MPVPQEADWIAIAKGFQDQWQFPNCIGAIDGKHVVIQAPPNSGSSFFNYKGTFSVVLMALVDAEYCFTLIDVGAYGSQSDGGIFALSAMGKALQGGKLSIPPPKPLPGAPELGSVPHVIVGDEAFPLKPYLMRPFPGQELDDNKRIFNYRLSRARRVVENAFGILAAKWRIYQRRIQLCPLTVDKVVKATCILHNFIKHTSTNASSNTTNHPLEVGRDHHGPICDLQNTGNHASQEAYDVRNTFTKYVMLPAGGVTWQRNACFGHAK